MDPRPAPGLPRRHVRLCRLRQAAGSAVLRSIEPGVHPGPDGSLRPDVADRRAGAARAAVCRGDRPGHRYRRDRGRPGSPHGPGVPSGGDHRCRTLAALLPDRVVGDTAVLLRRRSAVRSRVDHPRPCRPRRPADRPATDRLGERNPGAAETAGPPEGPRGSRGADGFAESARRAPGRRAWRAGTRRGIAVDPVPGRRRDRAGRDRAAGIGGACRQLGRRQSPAAGHRGWR